MKKLNGNKLVALLISAGMVTTFLAACSINTDELGRGISELGNAFETETTTKETDAPVVTEATETSATGETEETTTAAPTATPTATPSPTPLPERVDFSDYTEIDLTDSFKITSEDFQESAHSDDDTVEFAMFFGNRLVVTEAANDTARDAINLVVDGFYQEALGNYQRLVAKTKTEYLTTGVVETEGVVNVNFGYYTNGRALSVLMIYTVNGNNENTRTVDFATFDMLTGHYVTMNSVVSDTAGLEKACKSALADAIKAATLQAAQPTPTPSPTPAPATTTTTGAGTTTTVTTTTPTTVETTVVETVSEEDLPKADDFEWVYFAPAASETEGVHKATVIGLAKDGVIYEAEIEIDAYAGYFNRYGTSVFYV